MGLINFFLCASGVVDCWRSSSESARWVSSVSRDQQLVPDIIDRGRESIHYRVVVVSSKCCNKPIPGGGVAENTKNSAHFLQRWENGVSCPVTLNRSPLLLYFPSLLLPGEFRELSEEDACCVIWYSGRGGRYL